jgi:GT2 family glycosyltransferase
VICPVPLEIKSQELQIAPALGNVTVSVIVPVHNGGEEFRQCLQHLSGTEPRPEEVIVVVDGGADGSSQIAAAFGARAVRLPVTGGPARARNHGARAAKGSILLFIDSDVIVSSDVVSRVAAIFTGDPDLAALFGSYDDAPGASNFLSQYKNLLHHYVHQTGREEAFTFWAGCGAIRRDIFLALDGFDEAYRYPSIEDIELGYRLKRAGHRIRLCKELQVKHLKRWGTLSLLKADLLRRALPWTELILRHGRLPNDLNLKPSSYVSALVACFLALSLAGAWWKPGLLGAAAALALTLSALNLPLYTFFYRKRGLGFTLRAVPWHWFYYLYSSVTFAGAALFHIVRNRFGRVSRSNKIFSPLGRS